jgi:hypothetical protein
MVIVRVITGYDGKVVSVPALFSRAVSGSSISSNQISRIRFHVRNFEVSTATKIQVAVSCWNPTASLEDVTTQKFATCRFLVVFLRFYN